MAPACRGTVSEPTQIRPGVCAAAGDTRRFDRAFTMGQANQLCDLCRGSIKPPSSFLSFHKRLLVPNEFWWSFCECLGSLMRRASAREQVRSRWGDCGVRRLGEGADQSLLNAYQPTCVDEHTLTFSSTPIRTSYCEARGGGRRPAVRIISPALPLLAFFQTPTPLSSRLISSRRLDDCTTV